MFDNYNMRKVSFLALVLIILNAIGAGAQPVCADFSQLSTNKELFPTFLQNLPLLLTINIFGAKGAIRLRKVDDKLKTEFNIVSIKGDYKDDSYVKKICKDGEEYKFFLENSNSQKGGKESGVEIEIQEKGDKIFLSGHELKRSSGKDFDKIWNDVNESRKPSVLPHFGAR